MGFEPTTSTLARWHSSQLNYRRKKYEVFFAVPSFLLLHIGSEGRNIRPNQILFIPYTKLLYLFFPFLSIFFRPPVSICFLDYIFLADQPTDISFISATCTERIYCPYQNVFTVFLDYKSPTSLVVEPLDCSLRHNSKLLNNYF